MRVRPILPALLAAAVFALTGCGSAGQAATGRAPGRATEPARGQSVAAGGAATAPVTVPASLKFSAGTLDGRTFDGASLAGHPTVLWFWAPWCASCAGQAPTVSDIATEYKGRVDVVGVAGMGEEKEMRSFVSDLDVGGITHLSDKAGVVWKRFAVTEQSVYVLIDRNGKVVSKGWMDSQQFAERVAKLAVA